MRICLIDNYDSFTYNLSHYLSEIGAEVEVYRHDAITVDESLIGTIVEMSARFLFVYKHLAWAEDQDRIELLKAIKKVEKTKAPLKSTAKKTTKKD